MNLKNRIILEDYRKQRENFLEIEQIVDKKLKDIATKSGIFIMAIEHRVKTEKSLAGKLERNDNYQKFDDLTDILGARVICFFADEVDVLGKLIEKEFVIDWENSSDKRKLIDTNSFGYLSLHYICSLNKEEGYREELCNKRFEIQVRTNLQHTWAQIEHDLGYKNEFGVPRVVERSFARIAGMLELIDDEFVRTRDVMNNYTETVRQKIADNKADDVRIDTISLTEFVKHNKNMVSLLNELVKINNAEIDNVNPNAFIDQLRWFDITTLGGLQDMLSTYYNDALALAKKALSATELDIISSNIGLRYLCRAKLLKEYTEEKAVEFLKISLGDENSAKRQAKMLFRNVAK